ncbi:MAG: OmpA family protein [Chitinophagales bacterium]|nr:OmpA family protein [Chitinophagales bacterium]
MQKLLFIIFSAIWIPTFSQQEINLHVLFDTDIDTLAYEELQKLNPFIGQIKGISDYKEVYVVGYTDADGSSAYNNDLSKRRAEYVKKMLIKNGLDEQLIDENYKGESAPIALNTTENYKRLNRRVEITLKAYNFSSPADLINILNGNPTQKYFLDNTKNNTIEGEKGMRFYFPAYCFKNNTSPIDYAKIEVAITEVTNPIESIFSNTLAQSPEGILESGGMFKIEAYFNNQKLVMKDGMQYTVQIANNTDGNKKMMVYLPNNSNGLISWQASNIPFNNIAKFNGPQPTLKLDNKIIQEWKIPPFYDSILNNYSFYLPIKPSSPAYPQKPIMPKEPKISDARFQLKNLKKPFMSKSKKLKLQQEKFKKSYAEYEKNLNKYYSYIQKYSTDSANYQKQLSLYTERQEDYKENLVNCAIGLYKYKKAIKEYQILKNFPAARNTLQQRIDAGKFTSSTYFQELSDNIYSTIKIDAVTSYHLDKYSEYADKLIKAFKEAALGDIDNKSLNMSPDDIMGEILTRDKNVYDYINSRIDSLKTEQFNTGNFNKNNFSYFYQASFADLKWINCDRFIDVPYNMMAKISIPDNQFEGMNYYIVIKDINSVVSVYETKSTNIPKEKEITIVGVGYDSQKRPVFGQQKLKVQGDQTAKLTFNYVKLGELKAAIANI